MKKLIALVLFVGATLSFTACSSDDNEPHRNNEQTEGTWTSHKVAYVAFDENGEKLHGGENYDLEQIPFGKDPVTKEVFIIKGKNVILTEYTKSGKEVVTNGSLTDNVIKFEDTTKPERVIKNTSPQLILTYKMYIGKMEGILTTSYNRIN